MKFCQSYLFNATSEIWIIITLDKERSENECLHQHCGPRTDEESFVVPLTMIRKIHKNNRNKTDNCLEGWGVGDTHFTGSHIGGIHISLGICVRGYTYHGDTHITVTPPLGRFSSLRSPPKWQMYTTDAPAAIIGYHISNDCNRKRRRGIGGGEERADNRVTSKSLTSG